MHFTQNKNKQNKTKKHFKQQTNILTFNIVCLIPETPEGKTTIEYKYFLKQKIGH